MEVSERGLKSVYAKKCGGHNPFALFIVIKNIPQNSKNFKTGNDERICIY